jgi:hypothetical protein
MCVRCAVVCFFVMSLFVQAACAFTNQVGAVNGGGGVSSNVAYQSTGAIGPWAPSGQRSSATHWEHVGMLASFLHHASLDHDGDGIPDEDDWDDDNDGLRDSGELVGVAFTPLTPSDPLSGDSDGDGASDGQEAAAGTNPTDASSAFRIAEVRQEGATFVITWQGREGVSYDLSVSDSPHFTESSVVTNIVATGGTGTWLVSEVSATHVPSMLHLFYRVSIHE